MTRTPGATPWRAALTITACLALTALGTAAPAHAASNLDGDETGHRPPAAEQLAPAGGDSTDPRARDLGVSAVSAATGVGDDAVTRLAAGTGSITGTITELVDYTTNVPLQGATVTAHTYDEGTDTLSAALASATSAVDGTYALTGLGTGSYVVLVHDQTPGSKLLPDFYANAAYARDAVQVPVTDGQATPAIDELLAPLLSDYIAGASRYETSANIAAEFPADVDCVFLASGTNFPDALSAAPAAATCNGPLLLVEPTALPTAIADELDRLNPARIFIAGGTGAVAPGVAASAQALVPGATVTRLAGADRYGTSRAIVDAMFGTSDFVWIATGVNFPDALAASNAAAAYREPVLIVPGSAPSVDDATLTTIANRSPFGVAIAGGAGAVSTGIENQLWSMYAKIRLAGSDRYGTSLAINEWAWSTDDGASSIYAFVTNGTNFPDALSGAALAGGQFSAPMYTVPPACVPADVQQHITDLGVYEAYLLGYFSEISFDEPLKHC